MFVTEVVRRSAGVYIDAVRLGTRLAWWGANFTLEQMQRVVGSSGEPKPGMNDATLKAKVETELFRPADVPKGRVTIGVVDGVVELRGTAQTRQSRDLERRARGIPEVRDVENLLNPAQAPARGRSAAAARARKRSASPSQREDGGPQARSPSAGKRPAPTGKNRPAVSTERERPAASGQRPAPGTDERPSPSAGQRPAGGNGERAASNAERPALSAPERPSPGIGDRAAANTGDRPAPSTEERPSPGTGDRPAPSTDERLPVSAGERPIPRASVPLRNVRAPGIARSDPTHPRSNDVLGVLARQADSGDHVNQAEICKELGLDATEVADVLRTLSITNLVSRASTGNWELTRAGEREVVPGPRPKELGPREPQAS